MLYFRRMFLVRRRGVLSKQSVSACLINFLWRKRRECNIHLFLLVIVWCLMSKSYSLSTIASCYDSVSLSVLETQDFTAHTSDGSICEIRATRKAGSREVLDERSQVLFGYFRHPGKESNLRLSVFDFCWGCPFFFHPWRDARIKTNNTVVRIEGWHEWKGRNRNMQYLIWSLPHHLSSITFMYVRIWFWSRTESTSPERKDKRLCSSGRRVLTVSCLDICLLWEAISWNVSSVFLDKKDKRARHGSISWCLPLSLLSVNCNFFPPDSSLDICWSEETRGRKRIEEGITRNSINNSL